jgi:hypothetical protein
MVGVGEHILGGILKLLSILKDHWGAVELDLHAVGLTLDDLGSKLSLSGLVACVVHAPPGTRVFQKVHQGWTVNDHLQAQAIDALNMLVWSKTTDAQEKHPRHKPKPIPRPGMVEPVEEKHQSMTVGEYQKRLAERRGK